VTTADDIIENATIPEHANYLIDARDIGKVEDKQDWFQD
jgi:multiple sugar transport system substrate-binding protein